MVQFLLPDAGFSSSHPLNPGQHCLRQALDVGLRVESEVTWEDNGDITSPSLVTTPNIMMQIGVFVFHQYESALQTDTQIQ